MKGFKEFLSCFVRRTIPAKRSSPLVVTGVADTSIARRALTPVSSCFGFDRGQPIDRYYIESFLRKHRLLIRGRVLEIGEALYTKRFAVASDVISDVLHVVSGNPHATIVGSLETGDGIPSNAFDAIICTQTFCCTYGLTSAVANTFRALAPGGVLLASLPGISQISRYDMDRWGDYWRFTDGSTRRLFGDVFGNDNVEVETYGNVLAACAFLNGLAAGELQQEELDYLDRDYQILITVRALKPSRI